MDFGRPNVEIDWKMANGQLLFLALVLEHFQRKMSQILEGLEGVVCMMDSVLVYGCIQTEHDSRVLKLQELL